MTIQVCCECKKQMGEVEDGRAEISPSHGICTSCMRKNHPGAYAAARERDAMARGAELLAKRNAPKDTAAFARIISWDFNGLSEAA
jgi:hypothetical protein